MLRMAEAQELLRDMQYKPGWEFRLHYLQDAQYGDDVVGLEILYPAIDSSVGFRDGYRNQPTETLSARFRVRLHDMGNDRGVEEFYRAVITAIMGIEEHEAREFLRIKSLGFMAPFHPHRTSGDQYWNIGLNGAGLVALA